MIDKSHRRAEYLQGKSTEVSVDQSYPCKTLHSAGVTIERRNRRIRADGGRYAPLDFTVYFSVAIYPLDDRKPQLLRGDL